MGLLPLSYTRPKHVVQQSWRSSTAITPSNIVNTDGSVRSDSTGSTIGIPESLAFEKIVNGGTCPPMTVRDFMNYLIYVEHAAENLQFFLWYRDYEKRFNSTDNSDIALAPEWTQAMEDELVAKIRKDHADKQKKDSQAAEIFKGTDLEKRATELAAPEGSNPFNTPRRSPMTTSFNRDEVSVHSASNGAPSTHPSSHQIQASEAFRAGGARQPFTIQPFREEINRVIATYIIEGARRQLNLSASQQKAAMQALSYTTHPTAFRALVASVETALRHQAHPNFVRWSICNGNPARVFFARALGVGLILIGILVGIILALSDVGRGYRALTAIAFVLGISTLVAAYKGMCVVLHGLHHRHVRPWELFVDSDNITDLEEKRSFDTFGSKNSYEDEPWVVKYNKRNIVRKVFDREIWVEEPALRQIQDIIFIQAMLAAVVLGGIMTAIFVVVPKGGFF